MTLDQFAHLGVKWAIIVRRDVDRRFLDVAWTLSSLRGALLYLAVFCLAGMLADYWQDPKLAFLLRLVGTKLLFDGVVRFTIP